MSDSSQNNSLQKYLQLARQKAAIALQYWNTYTAPIRSRWATLTAPLRVYLKPATDKWQEFTAPVRARWAAFKTRYPMPGNILGWAGTLVKWGFYFLLFLIVGVWIGLFGSLPSTEELRNIETANATEIYTADSVLIGRYYIENRTAVSLDKISPHVINALIATEDRRFMDHSGIDFQSWVRVGLGMIAGKETGGGSTLSQQLAKNLYGRPKHWLPGMSLIINKIRENFISIRLERIYTKSELLNLYLNTVPFGGDVYGINIASRQYFNKKPKDLTPDQAATLIGMLKGTSIYHPVRRPENALKRRNVVLQQMVRNNHLTQQEYEELSKKPVGAKYYDRDGNNEGLGTYFREYLRTDVMPKLLKNYKKDDGENYNLYTDGLKIYTTINSRLQQIAEESVQAQMKKLQSLFDQHWKNYKSEKPWGDDKRIEEQIKRSDRWAIYNDAGKSAEEIAAEFEKPVRMTIFSWKNGGSEVDTTLSPIDSIRYYFCMLNCGFMAMDHRSGQVRAWVGGTNFKYFKFDHIKSTRQVGSTFKPIVYAAALQDSIRPCQYFPNEIKKIVDWEPHNADETYGGWYSLTGGLQKSVNVIAAQLIEKVGIQKTIDLARKMGITSELPREYGISLGAADISLYDMMKVYGTIANQGKRPEPVVVTRVMRRNGEVLFDYQEELTKNPELGAHVQALSKDHATIMTRMMQNVIDYGTGRRLHAYVGPETTFAGKTGTTQNQSDGWFICFNPQLVTGAWVGAESPAVRFRSMQLGQGSAMALPIVGEFWNRIAKDKKLSRQLLSERFPEARPDLLGQLSCYPWIGIEPDSFNLMMQDSFFRDSIATAYSQKKDKAEVESGEEEEEEGTEGATDPTDAEREQRREERKEKRREFFDKLIGGKKKDKDNNKEEQQE